MTTSNGIPTPLTVPFFVEDIGKVKTINPSWQKWFSSLSSTVTNVTNIVSITGNATFNNGTAAAPSVNFTGSATTGLYWGNPGIGYTVNGVSIGTMTSTGLNGMAVGLTTPSTGGFTTVSASSTITGTQLISTVAIGTAPFTVTSTTNVANLNASSLQGNTFAAPGTIGSGTPGNASFVAATLSGTLTLAVPSNVSSAVPTVASAGTIAITTPIAFVSGVTAVNTITAPAGLTNGGQITIIPTGLFTTTIAGNIALATTAIVSKALIMTYSASTSKWYPSY